MIADLAESWVPSQWYSAAILGGEVVSIAYMNEYMTSSSSEVISINLVWLSRFVLGYDNVSPR